jgi:Protein of unknown function (DUF3761)
MKMNHLARIVTAPLLMLAWSLSSQAADSAAPTTCKDGTASTATGRGACSGHGGVQKAATSSTSTSASPKAAAPAAAPPASVAPPAASTSPATATKPAASSSKATAASGNTDPTGATAKCKDGTYSKSQHHSGACSNHGGVAEWLNGAQ